MALVEMGAKDKKSAGRCGACQAMGCQAVPSSVTDEIKSFQRVVHTRFMKTSDLWKVYMELRRRFKKTWAGWMESLGYDE